jgi:hypothetical protein
LNDFKLAFNRIFSSSATVGTTLKAETSRASDRIFFMLFSFLAGISVLTSRPDRECTPAPRQYAMLQPGFLSAEPFRRQRQNPKAKGWRFSCPKVDFLLAGLCYSTRWRLKLSGRKHKVGPAGIRYSLVCESARSYAWPFLAKVNVFQPNLG